MNASTFVSAQNVCQRGHVLHDLQIVLSGYAFQYSALKTGERIVNFVLLPGDVVSFSFLNGQADPCDVEAVNTLRTGCLPARVLAQLSEQDPSIIANLLLENARHRAISDEIISSLSGRNAVQRVAHFLCEIHARLSEVKAVTLDNKFEWPFTQSQMGAILGLSTVHVNRTLQQLRGQNLLLADLHSIRLADIDALKEIAGFTDQYLARS